MILNHVSTIYRVILLDKLNRILDINNYNLLKDTIDYLKRNRISSAHSLFHSRLRLHNKEEMLKLNEKHIPEIHKENVKKIINLVYEELKLPN